jgi:WD40 repeat protein
LALVHKAEVTAAAFSSDGSTVVTGSKDHTARLWQTATAKPVGQPLKHFSGVNAVAFAPDGKTVLTGCQDGTVWHWDCRAGKPAWTDNEHPARVLAVAFSPNGNTVVTQSEDQTALLRDAPTGKLIGSPLEAGKVIRPPSEGGGVGTALAPIVVLAFSPNGKTVLTAGRSTAQLWDAATGKPTGGPFEHGNEVLDEWLAAAFSPDGSSVLTGRYGSADLWDTATGRLIRSLDPGRGVTDFDVRAVAFGPDGKSVLTGSDDAKARLWDLTTGRPIGAPMIHQAPVTAVAFSPDGKWFVTGSRDKTARLWETSTGKSLGPALRLGGKVRSLAFSPDGKTVLIVSADRSANLWKLSSPPGVAAASGLSADEKGDAVAEENRIETLLITTLRLPASSRIFRVNEDGTGRKPLTQGKKLEAEPALSPDGKRIAFVAETEEDSKTVGLCLMRSDGSGRVRIAKEAQGGLALAPSWSPDGKQIAFCTVVSDNKRIFTDPTVYVVDADGRHLRRLAAGLMPAWSTDGKRLLFTRLEEEAGSLCALEADGTNVQVLVKDLATGAWSPDGKSLAYVVIGDEAAGLFVARSDGSHARRLTGGADQVTLSPHWSRDGKRIFFTRKVFGKGERVPGGRPKGPPAAVYVIDRDGRNLHRVTSAEAPECLSGSLLFATHIVP